MSERLRSGLRALGDRLRRGELSVAELVADSRRVLQQASSLNAVITETQDAAIEAQAQAAQKAIDEGSAGPLAGIPLIHKDVFSTRDLRTTCASRMLADYVPPFDATVVGRLKQAGMVTLGKANMDEFAMGSSNENSFFGPVRNPWDTQRVPGGSSGGSAALVAAGAVPVATGSDTGGSIRQPAALCGVTGIKPTYGRASRHGMIAFASSLDQAGVFARYAADCALVLSAMCGHDPLDSTSDASGPVDYTADLEKPLTGVRLGMIPHWLEKTDAGIACVLEATRKALEKLGAQSVAVDLPTADLAVAAYYVLAPAEASANLARFDGVRYGHRCEEPTDLDDLYRRSRSEGFGDEVKRRILVGTWALSSGYYDAYYRRAQKVRRLIAEDFDRVFQQVDVLLAPVTPEVAFKLGEKTDPVSLYQSDVFTIPSSLAGLPGLSMPAGFSQGLPVGAQLIGPHFSESRLLNVAHQFQQHSDFHTQTPEMFS